MARARRRRTRRIMMIGLGLALIAWGALAGVALLRFRHETRAGIDRLEAARDTLDATDLVEGRGRDFLADAGESFEAARGSIRSPWVTPLRVLPVIGRQVRSADALASAAADVVAIGVDALDDARAQLDATRGPGDDRVALAREMAAIAGRVSTHLGDVDLGPSRALVGPLLEARRRFAAELADLDASVARAEGAAIGLTDLLEGPGTYLVLAANNAEMRVGSGAFLSIGTLRATDGRLDLSAMEPAEELTLVGDAPPLTGDVADRWGWLEPNREWRNLGASPRFDTQAELAAAMWETRTGDAVDGVLALDPIALRAVLVATGPVVVEGREISADNVVDEILRAQYLDAEGPEGQQRRRDRLSVIAREVVRALDEGEWDAATLFEELQRAAAGRHVLAWSSRDVQRRGWSAAGIDGVLDAGDLLLGVHNLGGNKLDAFLPVDAALSVEPGVDGVGVTLAVGLHNVATEGLPTYIAGPYPGASGAQEGLYQGMLVVQMPGAARDVTVEIDGEAVTGLVTDGPDGPSRVVAAYVAVPRDARVDAQVRFTLPADVSGLDVISSARVPAVTWSYREQAWDDTRARRVEW